MRRDVIGVDVAAADRRAWVKAMQQPDDTNLRLFVACLWVFLLTFAVGLLCVTG